MSAAHTVDCQRTLNASADNVWQIVSDFYSDWHPFIEQCVQEGATPVRRFSMPGSEQVYREQLIYYSDSQRCFRYQMLEGISGIERYRGGVLVEGADQGCLLRWWADIEGDEALVAQVTKGTVAVFEAGFDAIEGMLGAVLTPSPQPLSLIEGVVKVFSPCPPCGGRGWGRGGDVGTLPEISNLLNRFHPPSPTLTPARGEGRQALLVLRHPLIGRGAKDKTLDSLAPLRPTRERGPGGEGKELCGNLALSHQPSPNNPDWLCLFLHGIGGNRSNWDTQLPVITDIMPCAALDLRGYGDSTLGNEQATVEDYCADIRAVAKHFGTKHLVLAGLSYGSWIATHFALNYADELAGLALCGGCTGMSEAPEAVRQGFLNARLEPMDAGQTPAGFADNVVAIISGPEATEAQREAMKQSMAAIPAATYRDALHCFTHPPGRFDFGQLACPALLMTGEHDQLAPPEEIAGVAQRMVDTGRSSNAALPDVQFEVLAKAGHMANLEQPAAYNQVLSDFLQRISR